MKITKEFLKKWNAYPDGFEYVVKNGFIGLDTVSFVKKLMEHGKLDWANWLIVRAMKKPQYVAYAIYSAEQVIDIFEKKFPDDKRPRQAIEAAKEYLKTKNKGVAGDVAWAAGAAWAAAEAAEAAGAAAWAAGAAAEAAAGAAEAVGVAGDAGDAGDAAEAAAGAAEAAGDAENAMKTKILNYGLTLLEGKDE